jgi:hypothetical protein
MYWVYATHISTGAYHLHGSVSVIALTTEPPTPNMQARKTHGDKAGSSVCSLITDYRSTAAWISPTNITCDHASITAFSLFNACPMIS